MQLIHHSQFPPTFCLLSSTTTLVRRRPSPLAGSDVRHHHNNRNNIQPLYEQRAGDARTELTRHSVASSRWVNTFVITAFICVMLPT